MGPRATFRATGGDDLLWFTRRGSLRGTGNLAEQTRRLPRFTVEKNRIDRNQLPGIDRVPPLDRRDPVSQPDRESRPSLSRPRDQGGICRPNRRGHGSDNQYGTRQLFCQVGKYRIITSAPESPGTHA